MRTVGCLFLIYLAATARTMQGEMLSVVDVSAVAVVVVLRWCSPSIAAIGAFVAGLLADGLSSGPMGVQAAANVAAVALLMRGGYSPAVWSPPGWMAAVFSLMAANTAATLLSQVGPLFHETAWEQLLTSQSVAALATAAFVGAIAFGGRLLIGARCVTH